MGAPPQPYAMQQQPSPGAFYPGSNNTNNSRQTNIIPSGGPPPLMNSQYTNTFLMNCYQGVAAANGWAGVPLISTAKRRPLRKNTSAAYKAIDAKDFVAGCRSSMSKMALHAHGAPLILSHDNASCNKNGVSGAGVNVQGPRNGNGPLISRLPPSSSQTQPPPPPPPSMRYRSKSNQNAHRVQLNGGHQQQQRVSATSDNLHCDRGIKFVTDENSSILSNSSSASCSSTSSPGSSSSSDACLPRIIKPRKRRKKERKPGSNGLMSGDPREDNDLTGNHHELDSSKAASEEDFEDDEAAVSDFATSCSCKLCDPNSHIWSFPLMRRGCLPEDDHNNNSHHVSSGQSGVDLYQLQANSLKTQQHRAKDVGVIGGDRVNQQRSEWRGSPRQAQQANDLAVEECDDDLLNAKLDNGSQRGLMLMGTAASATLGHSGVLFGRWPMESSGSSKSAAALSDEESVDSFTCSNAFASGDDDLLRAATHSMRRSDYCGLSSGALQLQSDDDEELLIESLANLLNVSPKDSPGARSSDSGVSSASDCGSVFGECYSPLVNLGSPPTFAFHFPAANGGAGGIFPDNGLLSPAPPKSTRTFDELLWCSSTGHHLREEVETEEQKQHVLNCLDMDWYRAATTNRRLLMPYSNN